MSEVESLLSKWYSFIDYKKVINECKIFIPNEEKTDINFIVPVRGRKEFSKPLYNSFLNAKNKTKLKISFTIIELSPVNEHEEFCLNNNINYIYYKTKDGEPFNKCLGLNLGAILSNKTKAFLFHDIDCLIQSDFFNNLNENIIKKNAKAIQCFHSRRVLYLNQHLTNQAVNGNLEVDSLNLNTEGVTLPQNLGAPGGSIYIEKNLFLKIGGYDPEFFYGYAPEDIFFWNKVELVDIMHTSNDPEIEIFHMYHTPTFNTNPNLNSMLKFHTRFNQLPEKDKFKLIELKHNPIKEFFNE